MASAPTLKPLLLMNIRTLLNLVLVVVAALLALIVFYQPGIEPEQTPPPLTSADTEQIDTIRRIQEGREELRLERKEEGWFITAPIQATANPAKVKAFLEIAQAPSHSHYSIKEMDLSLVGLEPPKASLYLNDLAIDIGTTEPLNQRRYVRLGEVVHLIDDNPGISSIVALDAAGFVHTALLPGSAAITQLRLPKVEGSARSPTIDPKQTITLRQEQDTWIAEGTDNKPTSKEIADLVAAWQQQTAQQIKFKGDKAVLATVEVQRKGKPPIHFEILSTLPRPVLGRSDIGIQYHLPGVTWNTLFKLSQD